MLRVLVVQCYVMYEVALLLVVFCVLCVLLFLMEIPVRPLVRASKRTDNAFNNVKCCEKHAFPMTLLKQQRTMWLPLVVSLDEGKNIW